MIDRRSAGYFETFTTQELLDHVGTVALAMIEADSRLYVAFGTSAGGIWRRSARFSFWLVARNSSSCAGRTTVGFSHIKKL